MTNPQEALEWYSRKKEEVYINMENIFENGHPGNDFVRSIVGTKNYCGVVRTTSSAFALDVIKALMYRDCVSDIHIKYENVDLEDLCPILVITWEE